MVSMSRSKGDPDKEVFVARPSKWGNPFSHLPGTVARFRVETRQEAIEAYREWIQTRPDLLADLHELTGKDLVCYCSPEPCHGDVLLELANGPVPQMEQTSLF